MRVGTKSILFGVHAFWIHPIVVAIAWTRLFGLPWDPRLWVAFFVHDLGYWGKPNMDGPEGERHPELGARIMRRLFDPPGRIEMLHPDRTWTPRAVEGTWEALCLYHSRTYAKRDRQEPSKLAIADKYAWCLEPWWLYLPRAWASGELAEYLAHSKKEGGREWDSAREWYRNLQAYGKAAAQQGLEGRDMGTGAGVKL